MWIWLVAAALGQGLSDRVPTANDEVGVQIDWQAHPAMHIPWTMFGKGLTDRDLRRRSWKHMFKQTVSEPALSASGVRIFVAAAMAAERAETPRQARRLIGRQLDYVEDFIGRHPDRYALATTPAQAREILASTDKMVIVHSIEGMHHLMWDPEEDAQFWAERGVALATLIHLRDKELGGSAVLDRAMGALVNPRGASADRRGDRRGLTDLGEQVIVALNEAGILVDDTHSSPDVIDDALALCADRGFAPVFTHSKLASIRDDQFGLSDEQIIQIYQLGGIVSLGLNPEVLAGFDAPADVCLGTLEVWAWHHHAIQETLWNHAATILGDPTIVGEDDLTSEQRTRLATGWSSDWNGWVSHARPVYGDQECRSMADLEARGPAMAIDTRGLAHPGLLPEFFRRVEERGVRTDPMLRSSERFLQLWEIARGERTEARADLFATPF